MTPYRKRGERPLSRDFIRDLDVEALGWVEDGLLTAEQAGAIRARYADVAGLPAGEGPVSKTSAALYGTAGVLIGAASVALFYVENEWPRSAGPLLGATALLAIAAGGLRFARPRAWLLADAGFIGALVPFSVAPFVDERNPLLSIATLIVPLALALWRRASPFVFPLAIVASSVGAAATGLVCFPREDGVVWVVLQLGLVAGVVALDRLSKTRESTAAGVVAVFAAAISLLIYFKDTEWLGGGFRSAEVAVGLVMLAMALAGGSLRHRGTVIGACVALGLDAIVFAFDVGGLLTGTIALAATAGLLIWQAELVRRYTSAP
jgi:hypothetical protein